MNTRARIVTVCQHGAIAPTPGKTRELLLARAELAAKQRADLVCLPETCTMANVQHTPEELAERLPGPTFDAVARIARTHRTNIVLPILTRREGRIFNTAIVINRAGEMVGTYDKIQPVTSSPEYVEFESGVTPGQRAPVFNLDIGRIGVQICFDAGFPAPWQEMAEQGARLVVWASAYNGGFPLQAFAALHHYYVVTAVRSNAARIIDPCGRVLTTSDPINSIIWRDINLDFEVCHTDFNYAIPDRILAAHPGDVEIRCHPDDGLFIVEPLREGLTIAQLKKEFGFEGRMEYFQRHTRAFAQCATGSAPQPQQALHGRRSMYSKD